MLCKQLVRLAPVLALLSTTLPAQEFSLEQAMADLDWIGRAPQNPYWSDDGQHVYFSQKREGSRLVDLYRTERDGGNLQQIDGAELATIDVANGSLSTDGRYKTFARSGDIFVKDLRSGTTRQLTRTVAEESAPKFTVNNQRISFTRNGAHFIRDLQSNLEIQAGDLRSDDSPLQKELDKESSFLTEQQPRLFEIIRLQQERESARREFERSRQSDDPSRVELPFYLGEGVEILSTTLSPNERWLTAIVRDEDEEEPGRAGNMPSFVSETGYTENSELRVRVGTSEYAEQRLILLDREQHRFAEIDLGELPNRERDTLSEQLALEDDANDNGRAVALRRLSWSDDGQRLLFQARSRDNKDRWLVQVDTSALQLAEPDGELDNEKSKALTPGDDAISVIHHQHDPAWINIYAFTQSGWLPNSATAYFISEADGFGHLYLSDDEGTRQLTSGRFEVRNVTPSRDGNWLYFQGNLQHPTVYEIYRVATDDGAIEQLSILGGKNDYRLSLDEQRLLITHSEAAMPPELYVQRARPGASAERITNTVSIAFTDVPWTQPEFVEVPSSYSDDPIHSRVYTPDDAANNRPAVVFIHGAGYLQNAHQGWSGYAREFMFHHFLVQQGYVVLDMDYRASEGYGRDWRTAIYQQMGTPEVQDLADGVDWLVENKNVDRSRICTYGGSYGGFLTLMSLFTQPDLFACGAALRPVTDWASYNQGYTSNILNVPELDPEAYQRSSPIEYADGLQRPLLIAHGMLDDNVFFQDSVRLVQRLIELEKQDWEMAIYPIEPHGFREPSSWLDEYRRIYKLVDATIGTAP